MRIAAFDMDGTILFEDGIARETLDAVRAWQDAGHLAVLATGKSLSAARHALDGVDLAADYAVLYTGAVLTGPRWEVLHRSTLETDAVRRIVGRLSQVDGVAVYGTMLGERDVQFSSTIRDETASPVLTDFRDMAPEFIPGHEFVGVPVRVPDNEPLKLEIRDWITGTFDVGCVVNQNFVDVVPAGASKASGLERLYGRLGYRREEVELVTFGDSWNDLPMHAVADRSFSFPWSPAEVRERTTGVAGSVAEVLPHLI